MTSNSQEKIFHMKTTTKNKALHGKKRLVFNCQGTLVAWDGDHGINGHVLKYTGADLGGGCRGCVDR